MNTSVPAHFRIPPTCHFSQISYFGALLFLSPSLAFYKSSYVGMTNDHDMIIKRCLSQMCDGSSVLRSNSIHMFSFRNNCSTQCPNLKHILKMNFGTKHMGYAIPQCTRGQSENMYARTGNEYCHDIVSYNIQLS